MKIKPIIYLCILSGLLNACISPYHIYEIEVLEPAESPVPVYLNKIGILINNEISEADSFQYSLYNATYASIVRSLLQSPLIDTAIIVKDSFMPGLTDTLNLSWPYFEQLSIESDFDGFIGCDINIAKFSWVSSYSSSYYDEELMLTVQQKDFELSAESKISFYLLNPYYRSVNEQTLSGSYQWEDFAFTSVDEQSILEDSFDAMIYVASQIGERYARTIAPWWQSDTRLFFKGNLKLMKNAFHFVELDQLDEAAGLWLQIIQNEGNPNKKNIRYAYLNLALYYEINDRLDDAVGFALKANNGSNDLYAENYINTLRSRIIKKNQLDKQLNRQ